VRESSASKNYGENEENERDKKKKKNGNHSVENSAAMAEIVGISKQNHKSMRRSDFLVSQRRFC
jgi:hypothetical protein